MSLSQEKQVALQQAEFALQAELDDTGDRDGIMNEVRLSVGNGQVNGDIDSIKKRIRQYFGSHRP